MLTGAGDAVVDLLQEGDVGLVVFDGVDNPPQVVSPVDAADAFVDVVAQQAEVHAGPFSRPSLVAMRAVVRATSSSSVSRAISSGVIGSWNDSEIGRGRGKAAPRGRAANAPSMVVGTMVAPPRRAIAQKPDWKGWSRPSSVRVPSGKTIAASPARSMPNSARMPPVALPRSTGTAPNERINQPKGPTNSDARASAPTCRGLATPSRTGAGWLLGLRA